MDTHKEFQQCHAAELDAHTSLVRTMNELYVSVLSLFGEAYGIPLPRKLIKVQEVVQQIQA
jgi:hypothetical protein